MITVYLRKSNGKGDRMSIRTNNSVAELVSQINSRFAGRNAEQNGSANKFDVFFKGEQMEESSQSSIEAAGIGANSILHLVEKQQLDGDANDKIKIRWVLKEKMFQYEFDKDKTIGQVKRFICSQLDVKREDDLTLSALGVELDSTKTIKQCRFNNDVLISAVVDGYVNLQKRERNGKVHSLGRESQSEESEGAPQIVRQSSGGSPMRTKKTASLNIETTTQLKNKNVFASVNLKKIDEKLSESRNDSQINQTDQFEQEKSSEIVCEEGENRNEGQRPKVSLQDWSKPCLGTQKIIQTQSIIDEDEEDESYLQCQVQFTRNDGKRQYVLQCSKGDTFAQASNRLSQLQKVDQNMLKLIVNFDEVRRSGISSRSSKGLNNSPRSATRNKTITLESKEILKSLQYKTDGLKMNIVDYASRVKKKDLSFEYFISGQI